MRIHAIDVPDLAAADMARPRAELSARMLDAIGVYEVVLDTDAGVVRVTYDEGWLGEAGLMGMVADAGFTVPDLPTRGGG